jgi:hypothetical protein
MLRMLCRFFAGRSRFLASSIFSSSNWASRWTDRGISKGGEPSKPTFLRIVPSIGIITFVARRQFSPTRAPMGNVTSLPRKLRPAIRTRESRNEVLEKSAFIIFRPSDTMVPVPTEFRNGDSWANAGPKFDPVCSTRPRS